MVTPEMLLFLAERMGMPEPYLQPQADMRKRCVYLETWQSMRGYENDFCEFNPATDDAQFGLLVVWAAMQRLYVGVHDDGVVCGQGANRAGRIGMEKHDSTPDSIRAAAVVAIVRALGYREEDK